MSLNTLLEHGRTAAEYGRGLAERVPYSLRHECRFGPQSAIGAP
jgi:hypothetical protein